MKLNKETIENLEVLGFGGDVLPKMKELRKRYLELSLVRHPDKRSGTDEEFQKLLNAYLEIGKLIEKASNTDTDDREEDKARREFKESNYEKINKASITIKIISSHVMAWEQIFTEEYGNPKNISVANATKQWFVPYKLNEEDFGVIKVTVWNLSKKDKSTMLIQGEHLKQYLNISFAEKVVPQLFIEVLLKMPDGINGHDKPKPKMTARQRLFRSCKKCLPDIHNFFGEKKVLFKENYKDDQKGLNNPENWK